MKEYLKPKVVILMATYNGLHWISEQVTSILNQIDVEVTLYISDDVSTDGTQHWLESLSKEADQVHILPKVKRLGSAGKNFYRLIIDSNIEGYDYVAFSDQDDIWQPNKLISHIKLLKRHHADGVSSNVLAFWPDGKKKLIVKSQLQKKWDFLFESAGPGCTFLMTPWLIDKVREQLLNKESHASAVVMHDWLTYAVCRGHGYKWIIDSTPSVLYRQHNNNVIGANFGLKAIWARLMKVRQGWYQAEIIKICQVCINISSKNEYKKLIFLVTSKNVFSHLKLLFYVPQARRKFSDKLGLGLLITMFLL
jgi:rhamnosyltransferase